MNSMELRPASGTHRFTMRPPSVDSDLGHGPVRVLENPLLCILTAIEGQRHHLAILRGGLYQP